MTRSDKNARTQSVSDELSDAATSVKEDDTVKKLLEELYVDKKFLDKILKDSSNTFLTSVKNISIFMFVLY